MVSSILETENGLESINRKAMKLKKIINKNFPFPRYTALTFCPWVFIREDSKEDYTSKVERHETTHALQQRETLWLFFLLIYGLEYLIKLPFCGFDHCKAYKSVSFEQEAYEHEAETYYNDVRKHYAWLGYVFSVKE